MVWDSPGYDATTGLPVFSPNGPTPGLPATNCGGGTFDCCTFPPCVANYSVAWAGNFAGCTWACIQEPISPQAVTYASFCQWSALGGGFRGTVDIQLIGGTYPNCVWQVIIGCQTVDNAGSYWLGTHVGRTPNQNADGTAAGPYTHVLGGCNLGLGVYNINNVTVT